MGEECRKDTEGHVKRLQFSITTSSCRRCRKHGMPFGSKRRINFILSLFLSLCSCLCLCHVFSGSVSSPLFSSFPARARVCVYVCTRTRARPSVHECGQCVRKPSSLRTTAAMVLFAKQGLKRKVISGSSSHPCRY